MIFVTLGSQKFQFNRLLIEIDKLIEDGKITEEVFAQTGYSDYKPKNYEYKNFLDREVFNEMMHKCEIVITHGGTGAIINALKSKKKVIAIPRLVKFGEHVDNHQIEIVKQFIEMNLIYNNLELCYLKKSVSEIKNIKFNTYKSSTSTIIRSIEQFIDKPNIISDYFSER